MADTATVAPLDDPTYVPLHPPTNGQIPEVVAKWGMRSQLRWFRRFGSQLGQRTDWDRYYCTSEYHRGICCTSCWDEYQDGYGVMMDGRCCCHDQRPRA